MKKRLRLQIAFWLAFAFFLLSTSSVNAQEMPPNRFYGTVTVGGSPALDGTIVTAMINGVPVANTETSGGMYVIDVHGEPNDNVVFFVDNYEAATHLFVESGVFTRLNLSMPAPEFVVSDLVIDPTEVHLRDTVTITAEVRNDGPVRFAHTLTLLINGWTEATRDVALTAGAAASVTFWVTKDAEGTYSVEVDGNTGAFNVTEPATPPPTPPSPPPTFAEFTVTALTIVPDAVSAGDRVAIIVDVKNIGNAQGTHTLTLRVNGEPVQTKGITLAGGASGEVTFIMFGDIGGTYDVEVDGLTGSFTVAPSPGIPSVGVEIPVITPEAPASLGFENAVITELEIIVVHTVENVWVDISELTERPADVPIPPGLTYRYLGIAKENIEDNEIGSVTISFRVEKTWIDLQGMDENKIGLNRFENDEWVPLPTTKVGGDNAYVRYSATSPGLSIFAITCEPLAPASFEVSSLEITPDRVSVGEAVAIRVTVTNGGDLGGVCGVNLKVNGVVVATENLALTGKESKPLSFTLSENVEGTYDVEVDGLTGSFTVVESPPSIGSPWGIVIALMCALVVAAVALYARRRKKLLTQSKSDHDQKTSQFARRTPPARGASV